MAIQNWSEDIILADLAEDPQFSEDLSSLMVALDERAANVVLNFSTVSFINSSNIARLLRLRKFMSTHKRRLILCGVNPHVWSIFHVTGLDKTFEFTNDVATALATVQLSKA